MSEVVIEPEADEPIDSRQLREVEPSVVDRIIDEPIANEEEGV